MISNESNISFALPVELRNKTDLTTVAIIGQSDVHHHTARLASFAVSDMIARATTASIDGEVDYIFFLSCMQAKLDRAVMARTASKLASIAQTINIYGHKLNQAELMHMLNLSSGVSKPTASARIEDLSINEIMANREAIEKFTRTATTENEQSQDPVAMAMMFSGMGKIYNVTEPADLVAYMNKLLELLRVTDGAGDPDKFRNYTALAIYLAATAEYDTGVFSKKISLAPQGLYQAKAITMVEYAHMILAVAYATEVMSIITTLDQMASLKALINMKAGWRWTSVMEDQFVKLSDAIASVKDRNPLLPFAPMSTMLSSFRQSLGVDMILPSSFFAKDNLETRCSELGKVKVQPGEDSLYLPLGESTVISEEQLALWFTSYSKCYQTASDLVHDLTSGVNSIQLSDDMRPRLRVDFPTSSYPSFFKPRFATISDKLPATVGLRKYNINGNRVLAPYINGLCSYRAIHDAVMEDFPVTARLDSFDLSSALNVHPALLQLPIPSVYLKGEAYDTVTMRDETMTSKIQELGLAVPLSYTKAVEVLLFSLDAKYHAYYATLLSGAFIVIMHKDKVGKGVPSEPFMGDYVYVKPGIAPFSSSMTSKRPKEEVNYPVSYGIRSDDMVNANAQVWRKVIATDFNESKEFDITLFKRWIMWSDDSLSFGLLPLCIIPAPRLSTSTFKMIDGKTALLFHEAKFSGEITWIQNFSWTNIFSALPHFSMSFINGQALTPIAKRVGITGPNFVAFMADVITRPEPADLQFAPTPWMPAPTVKNGASQVDLNTIKPLDLEVDRSLPPEDPKPVEPPSKPVDLPTEPAIPTVDAMATAAESNGDVTPPPAEPVPDTEEVDVAKKKKKKGDAESSVDEASDK